MENTVEAILNSYKIEKLDMINKIEESSQIELMNTFDFDVIYSKDKSIAKARLTEYVNLKDIPEQFNITLTIVGLFQLKGVTDNEKKKEAHVCCYDQLFPFASQIITQLATNSGMSGLILKKLPLNPDQINFGKKDESHHSDKMLEFPTNGELS